MGGPPPRSTVSIQRQWIGGRCFAVRPGVLRVGSARAVHAPWVDHSLRVDGATALLALLLTPLEPTDSFRARVSRAKRRLRGTRDVLALTDRTIEGLLIDAGVLPRVGVFLPPARTLPPDTTELAFAASLAVLARRSGPLYLPRRRFHAGLIDPTDALLVFPDEEVGESRTPSPAS